MKKRGLDKMINNALPYFIGGALLFWAYKRYMYSSFYKVEEKLVLMSVNWSFLSSEDKEAYLVQAANYIYDRTWNTPFSWLRDTSKVRDFIKANSFCLLELGKQFSKTTGFGTFIFFSQNLSDTINGRLNPDDFMLLDNEYNLLKENGL